MVASSPRNRKEVLLSWEETGFQQVQTKGRWLVCCWKISNSLCGVRTVLRMCSASVMWPRHIQDVTTHFHLLLLSLKSLCHGNFAFLVSLLVSASTGCAQCSHQSDVILLLHQSLYPGLPRALRQFPSSCPVKGKVLPKAYLPHTTWGSQLPLCPGSPYTLSHFLCSSYSGPLAVSLHASIEISSAQTCI